MLKLCIPLNFGVSVSVFNWTSLSTWSLLFFPLAFCKSYWIRFVDTNVYFKLDQCVPQNLWITWSTCMQCTILESNNFYFNPAECSKGGKCSTKERSCVLRRYSHFAIYGSLWASCSQNHSHLWVWGELNLEHYTSTEHLHGLIYIRLIFSQYK